MMQLTRLLWLMAFLAAAQAGPASVRDATKDQPPPTEQPSRQDQPPPTIRVGTEVVRVDVTVLDRRGRPVTDLTMEDFIVEEDGTAQAITSFKLTGRVIWTPRPGTPAADAVAEVSVIARTVEGSVFDGAVDPREGSGFSVTPGSLQLTIAFHNSAGEVVDGEIRKLVVPDPAGTPLGLTTPAVFRARAPLEWRALRAAAAPVPTALRDFARTDRLLIRVDAFGAAAGVAQATARLVNRRGIDGAPIPVGVRGDGRFEIDLPLTNIAAGEWLLAIDAAAGEDRAQVRLPFRIDR